jgi:hypothetical protein
MKERDRRTLARLKRQYGKQAVIEELEVEPDRPRRRAGRPARLLGDALGVWAAIEARRRDVPGAATLNSAAELLARDLKACCPWVKLSGDTLAKMHRRARSFLARSMDKAHWDRAHAASLPALFTAVPETGVLQGQAIDRKAWATLTGARGAPMLHLILPLFMQSA